MRELLFFVLGLMIGGMTGIILMSFIFVNKLNRNEDITNREGD